MIEALWAAATLLAGHVPDGELVSLRWSVLNDEPEDAVEVVEWLASGARPALDAVEADALRRLANAAAEPASSALRRLAVEMPTGSTPPPWEFLPARHDHPDRDRDDYEAVLAAIDAVAIEQVDDGAEHVTAEVVTPPFTARALWRAHRADRGIDIRLIALEIPAGIDPAEECMDVAALVMARLAELGDEHPQVEVFDQRAALGRYQREALAAASLVWTDREPPVPRLATVFDGVDPAGTPFFGPGHPRLQEAEREAVQDYLHRAELVIDGGGRLDDIVTGEPDCVPCGYRADGSWVWSEASTYYLERYGLQPDRMLCEHLRDAGTGPGPLTWLQRKLAHETLTRPEQDIPAAATG